MKYFSGVILPLGLIGIVFGLVFFSETVIPTVASTVGICIQSVIPSLFPFLVCSRILLAYDVCETIGKCIGKPFRKLFRLPEDFAGCFLLGSLCGFPTGARVSADLFSTNRFTKRQAIVGAILCNNAGPLFIIGTLGTTLLKNVSVGKTLWIIHILSAILVSLLMRSFLPTPPAYKKVRKTAKKQLFSSVFTDAVSESVTLILQICGLVVFFGALIRVLISFGMPERGLIVGCIELTSGLIYETKDAHISMLPIISFLLGFGGLSVLMQASVFFVPHNLPLFPYLMGKIIQGGISATLTYLYFHFFPTSVETVAVNPFYESHTSTLTVVSLVLLVIYLLKQKIIQGSP